MIWADRRLQFKSSVNTAVGALQDQRKQQAGETVSHVLTETGQKRKVQEERNHIARGTTTVTSTCMLGRTMHETGTSMCMSRQAAPLRVRQSVPAAGSASNFELLLSTIVYYRRRRRSPPHNLWPTAFRFLISICFCSSRAGGVRYGHGWSSAAMWLVCAPRVSESRHAATSQNENTNRNSSFRTAARPAATRNDIHLDRKQMKGAAGLQEHLNAFRHATSISYNDWEQ